jgi:hypothetical protein
MNTPESQLIQEVLTELERARKLFKPIYSPHEGLGIVMEEFEEFKDEVYAFNLAKGRDTRPKMREELIQLATMSLRVILDALEFDPTAVPQEHHEEVYVPLAQKCKSDKDENIKYGMHSYASTVLTRKPGVGDVAQVVDMYGDFVLPKPSMITSIVETDSSVQLSKRWVKFFGQLGYFSEEQVVWP